MFLNGKNNKLFHIKDILLNIYNITYIIYHWTLNIEYKDYSKSEKEYFDLKYSDLRVNLLINVLIIIYYKFDNAVILFIKIAILQ